MERRKTDKNGGEIGIEGDHSLQKIPVLMPPQMQVHSVPGGSLIQQEIHRKIPDHTLTTLGPLLESSAWDGQMGSGQLLASSSLSRN